MKIKSISVLVILLLVSFFLKAQTAFREGVVSVSRQGGIITTNIPQNGQVLFSDGTIFYWDFSTNAPATNVVLAGQIIKASGSTTAVIATQTIGTTNIALSQITAALMANDLDTNVFSASGVTHLMQLLSPLTNSINNAWLTNKLSAGVDTNVFSAGGIAHLLQLSANSFTFSNSFVAAGNHITIVTNVVGGKTLYTITASSDFVTQGDGITLSTNTGVVTIATSLSAGSNIQLSTNGSGVITVTATGGAGSGFPLATDGNANSFAVTNLKYFAFSGGAIITNSIADTNAFAILNANGQFVIQGNTNGVTILGTNGQFLLDTTGNLTLSAAGSFLGIIDREFSIAGFVTNSAAGRFGTMSTVPDAMQGPNVTLQGNQFNGTNELVQTDDNGRLPAIDGSQLTGVQSLNSAGSIFIQSSYTLTTNGTAYYVATNGSSANDGLTALTPWTLTYALANAGPSNTIILLPGAYSGGLSLATPSIHNGLMIESQTRLGASLLPATGLHSFNSPNTVSNLTIKGIHFNKAWLDAIKFDIGSQGHTVADCWIHDAGHGNPAWVTNNGTLSGQGFHAEQSRNITLRNCLIETNGAYVHHDHGVYWSGTNNLCDGCVIRGNLAYGIQQFSSAGSGNGSANCIYINCLIYGNDREFNEGQRCFTSYQSDAGQFAFTNYAYNCIFGNNGTSEPVSANEGGFLTLTNCIFFTPYTYCVIAQTSARAVIDYCLYTNTLPDISGLYTIGTHNVATNNFGWVSESSGLFWPAINSPVRGKAFGTVYNTGKDIHSVTITSITDIGPYAYSATYAADLRTLYPTPSSGADYWAQVLTVPELFAQSKELADATNVIAGYARTLNSQGTNNTTQATNDLNTATVAKLVTSTNSTTLFNQGMAKLDAQNNFTGTSNNFSTTIGIGTNGWTVSKDGDGNLSSAFYGFYGDGTVVNGVTNDATETVIASTTIPGHLIGPKGFLEVTVLGQTGWTTPNNATINVRYGASGITGTVVASMTYGTATTSTLRSEYQMRTIYNLNSESKQIAMTPTSATYTDSGGVVTTASFDTTTNFLLAITIKANGAVGTNTINIATVKITPRH